MHIQRHTLSICVDDSVLIHARGGHVKRWHKSQDRWHAGCLLQFSHAQQQVVRSGMVLETACLFVRAGACVLVPGRAVEQTLAPAVLEPGYIP